MQLSVVPNGMYVVLPVVPTCIYTEPEIAAVGFTENDARLYNMKIKCGVAYMTENGKALLARNSRGFVRLIFEAYTNTLIGAQIMCARATDMRDGNGDRQRSYGISALDGDARASDVQ